jgi:inhibitor of cysteine peptidase
MNRAMPTVNGQCAGAVLSQIIAGAMAGLLSACVLTGPSKPTEARMSTVLTAADDAKTVELRVGSDAVLRLPENATTGYRWAVDAVDRSLIEIKEGQYLSASNTVGSGGEAQWILHAKAAGVTQLKLKRWRHWEGERSVIERYEVTLRIVP